MNIEQWSMNKLAAGSRESAPPNESRESPLSKPVFVALVGAGYVCAAFAFYFMFNQIGAH
jgi:hypothetical protein